MRTIGALAIASIAGIGIACRPMEADCIGYNDCTAYAERRRGGGRD